ncbi:MAG: AMP-binding protein [Syntrophales bacterium]|jgi:long-chain acyl-CoA synthetase|nr:AMP-binding protein [Syntrophales bacterium]MDY0045366.1 AMP-binding protein [Syntrophales bacterium]
MKIRKIDSTILDEMKKMTLPQILRMHAGHLPAEYTAIREKAYGKWEIRNWKDYFSCVKRTGLGLIQLGFRRGENLAIIMDNHQEWLFAELGAQALGGITLNLFTSAIASELAYGLNRADAAYVVAQDQEQVDKLLEIRDKLPFVRKVIYIDPTGMRTYEDPWLISYKELIALGKRLENDDPGLFEKEIKKGKTDDIAVMIMTSGTTGIAKLAMLSHANFIDIGRKWIETAPIGMNSNWLSISPPPWIVDQMWGVGVALAGAMTMNFPETPDTISEDFRELGPHVIITSSRFWEDLASSIRVKINDAGFVKRLFFSKAESIGGKILDLRNENKKIPFRLKLLQEIASFTLYRPLLDRIGCSQLESAYTGGHPVSPDVIKFFRSIGLNLKQCYGLTEAGGIFQVQPDDEVKAETVGIPLPRTRVKISENGEVLVSSASIFRGYHKDYDATESAFEEGWLKTGDAGYLDDDGHLVIIGRKEEIIRDKEGRAFSPDFIETRLKFSPFIKEAVIFGEGRPYITAFINIDMGNVGNWAEDRMIPYTTYTDLSQQAEVERLILEEIGNVNERMPEPMRIRRFLLLYKLLDADDEELTRTGKVRRRFVYGLYLKLIEAMYNGKKQIDVKGKVHYRDGHTGSIETTVRILDA